MSGVLSVAGLGLRRGARDILAEVTFDVPEAGVVEGRVQTNFKVKYLREGRPIYQIALQRE